MDQLWAFRAKRKLFSLLSRIFLEEDLIRSQVVEVKRYRVLVIAPIQVGKWVVIRNLRDVIWDSFSPWMGISTWVLQMMGLSREVIGLGYFSRLLE